VRDVEERRVTLSGLIALLGYVLWQVRHFASDSTGSSTATSADAAAAP
jgi:hypothetical protein